MILLYLKECSWEVDFIIYDLLYKIPNLQIEFIYKDYFELLPNRKNIINNNILVLNNVISFKIAEEVVKKIKPKIIFFLGDEYGTSENYMSLSKYTYYFFRNYHFAHYTYDSNNIQFPLGYVVNYISKKNSFTISSKKIKERNINASFIGGYKSDREYMATLFEKKMEKTFIRNVHNDWKIDTLKYLPEDIYKIYNNSIYVIIGRGNASLDCFRIYEAVVAGALPVIVGSQLEIKTTFYYNNSIPPFLFFENWDIACETCTYLLDKPEILQDLQDKILSWWKSYISFITEKIENGYSTTKYEMLVQYNEV
jgi:hypothetical protein